MVIDDKEYERLLERDTFLLALEEEGINTCEVYKVVQKKQLKEKEKLEEIKKIKDVLGNDFYNILDILENGVYEARECSRIYAFSSENIDEAEEVFANAVLKYKESKTKEE